MGLLLLSKKVKINNLQIKLLEIIDKDEAKAIVVIFVFIVEIILIKFFGKIKSPIIKSVKKPI